jgi:hypothetical protein
MEPDYPFGCLGSNYQEKIEELIDERMREIHDEHTNSYQGILKFQAAEQRLRNNLCDDLTKFSKICSNYRADNGLAPFSWARESIDSVRDALTTKKGKVRTPQTPAERAARMLHQKRSEVRDVKIKPEYQGANHPLEQSQVKRERKTVKASDAAIAALKQFDTTGKLIIPDNSQSRIQHDRDNKQWLREMPETKKTALEAEPISDIIADVSKRLKVVLDNPSNANFKTFMEKYKS